MSLGNFGKLIGVSGNVKKDDTCTLRDHRPNFYS